MANKVRVEIPIQDGVSLLIDADKPNGSGFNAEARVVYLCKEFDITVCFWPTPPSVERES